MERAKHTGVTRIQGLPDVVTLTSEITWTVVLRPGPRASLIAAEEVVIDWRGQLHPSVLYLSLDGRAVDFRRIAACLQQRQHERGELVAHRQACKCDPHVVAGPGDPERRRARARRDVGATQLTVADQR